jgi:intracellular multiplication protein IcmL
MADIQAPQIQNTETYRTGFKNLLALVKFMGFAILCLTFMLYYYIKNNPRQDLYYAQTPQGQTLRMNALSEPNMNNEAILAWAAQAVTDVLTFGFHDYNKRFEQTHKNFSPEGWTSFLTSITKSNFLGIVEEKKQILTTILSAPPELKWFGVTEGRQTWVVQMNYVMKTRAGGSSSSRKGGVLLWIVKMPTEQNPMGLGIQTWRSL